MRHLHLIFCIVLACAVVLAATLWRRYQNSEVSAVEYGALYSLHRMDPDLFREKLLPELEKALADGRLTRAELRAIQARVNNLGAAFLKAAQAPSPQDDGLFGENLRESEKKAREAGRGLGDTLGRVFNEALDQMLRKSGELPGKALPAPRSEAEPPVRF